MKRGGGAWRAAAGLALVWAGAAWGESPPGASAYLEGLQAYRAQHYEAALAAFSRAQAEGHADPNLIFNLGLVYRRLDRDAEARALFESLRAFADHRAAAEYQLGLIAVGQSQLKTAIGHLRAAVATAPNEGLRRVAQAALNRLGAAPINPRPDLLLSLSAGHDSNPALVNDSFGIIKISDASAHVDAYAQARLPLATGRRVAVDVSGDFYLREYLELSAFDQATLQVKGNLHRYWPGWRLSLAAGAEVTWLDDRRLQHLGLLETVLSHIRGRRSLELRAQLGVVEAAEPFTSLDGDRQRIGLRWRQPLAAAQILFDYQLELNQRRDLTSGPQFLSQSPTRHQVLAELRHGPVAGWGLDWQLRYRFSDYADDNRFFGPGGEFLRATRRDQLYSVGLQARHALGARVTGLFGYRYDHNQSGLSIYDYDRHNLTVGVEWRR